MMLHNSTGMRRGCSGFALLMVLMLIATASVVGVSYIYGSQVKTASTVNLMLASQARYLAESGLQHGLHSLQTGLTSFGSAASPNGPYHIVGGDGGYEFYIAETSTPNDYRVVGIGKTRGITQTVSMTVRLTSDYSRKIREIDPEYWWRLGDAGFTAVDEQGNQNGAYVNGVIRGVDGALLGDSDAAASFRGGNDYVNLTGLDDISSDEITFGCWVRADAWATAFPRIITRSMSPDLYDRRWEIALTDARKLRFTVRLRNTVYELVGQTPFQLGQWYFITATFNKNLQQMRVYLNGELDGTRSGVLQESINDSGGMPVWIGDCPNAAGQRPWAGAIDEVFILKDVVLSSDKVKELYDTHIPKVEVISWDD